MGFEQFLRLVKDGQPVRAGTVNDPLRGIDANVRYLWDLIQAAGIGSTVYAHRQTVAATVRTGQPVYFDQTTQRFEAALATAVVDDGTGVVATAPSALVWGVVGPKISDTLADVLLYGLAEIDLTASAGAGAAPGLYYLSAQTPGRLTPQKPPVSVAVLRLLPDGRVFVTPQFVDFLDRHVHYRFNLVCRPAGTVTPPADGARHVITDADAALPGWLPAGHDVFEGNAPPGAVFGYNLAADPRLAAVWPPLPASNAEVEWDRGLDRDSGLIPIPLGPTGLCVLDRNGLWWMSDCYGDVPWPVALDTTTSDSASASESSSAPECPRAIEMQMVVYFTKVNFQTDATAVLSLRSGDARVKVRCLTNPDKPAVAGHLVITLDLNLTVADDQDGYSALKEFDPVTAQFRRGPVVEGLYALGSNVILGGSKVSTRAVDGLNRQVYQGLVAVTVNPADTMELDVQTVRLDGAEEAWTGSPPLMYLEFIAGDDREYRGKLHVPYDLAIPTPQLKLRFQILGRAAGTLPQLTFSGRRVGRPAGLDVPSDLPPDGDEFDITCPTVTALSATNQYVEAESEPFAVAAGDTVYFTVRRSASDGYAAAVGILRQSGVVVSGA